MAVVSEHSKGKWIDRLPHLMLHIVDSCIPANSKSPQLFHFFNLVRTLKTSFALQIDPSVVIIVHAIQIVNRVGDYTLWKSAEINAKLIFSFQWIENILVHEN